MAFINISLDTLKEIVAKADEELGGTNGTVYIEHNQDFANNDDESACWSSKESYYKSKLSFHELAVITDTFYEHQTQYSQIISKKRKLPKI